MHYQYSENKSVGQCCSDYKAVWAFVTTLAKIQLSYDAPYNNSLIKLINRKKNSQTNQLTDDKSPTRQLNDKRLLYSHVISV